MEGENNTQILCVKSQPIYLSEKIKTFGRKKNNHFLHVNHKILVPFEFVQPSHNFSQYLT